jgi:hypothetical protein
MGSPGANQEQAERRFDGIIRIKQQDWMVKLSFRTISIDLASPNFKNSFARMKRGMIVLLAAVASAASARGAVLFAGGAWAAIDRGKVCEALSRSQNIAPRDKVQAEAGITFSADARRSAEVHVRLSRMPRGDATVILHVGDQPFLLVTRGGWAWSRGPLQAQAIMEALRIGTTMRAESRDVAGVRFSDPYLLDGAPTAIDAAAARCALRGAGKIQ